MFTTEPKTTSFATRAKTDQRFFSKRAEESFFGKGNPDKHSFFNPSSAFSVNGNGVLQTKLTIGQPDDKYEKEADKMADQVVQRISGSGNKTGNGIMIRTKQENTSLSSIIQRKCAHCEEEEKKQQKENKSSGNIIRRKCAACESAFAKATADKESAFAKATADKESAFAKASADKESAFAKASADKGEKKLQPKKEQSSVATASPHIESTLNTSKGNGSPLPASTRTQMEHSFGMDFSNVKLHTDSRAVQMNKDLHAQAFTHGSDIYFNGGKYNPDTSSGKHLLAHELTHVVQQREGISPKIQRLGDLTKVPPMDCDVANSSPAGVTALTSFFPTSHADLTPDQKNDIAIFVASWRASGASDTLRVDGYASTSGTDEFNWKLSCDRALSVANELIINGVPNSMIEIFAQGETSEFGASGNNQRANITLIAPPPTPEITSETVVASPGSRARTTIGVGEEVNLTHSLGNSATTWATTAGTLTPAIGARVKFTAPDTKQNVTITADGASITFRVLAPTDVHMDNVGGTVKHHQNFPDSGILTDVFLLPDNVNFNKVRYRELDVVGVPSPGGAYSCNTFSGGHCAPAGLAPCGDKALTTTVISGKGTKSVLGDCAYSGHCGGSPPFTPGIITVTIPYEYKVGAGSFRRFATVVQFHSLMPGSVLITIKAGAVGVTTVGAPTSLIGVCP